MQLISDTEFLSTNQFQIDKHLPEKDDTHPMQNSVPDTESILATAKRRLLSMVYDSLLLAAVLFVAFAIFIKISEMTDIEPAHSIKSVYLLSVIFFFYAGFWTHGGQTLGMKTWRIKLVHENGQAISWGQALLRYMGALPSWFIIILSIRNKYFVQSLPFPEAFEWIDNIPWWVILLAGLLMIFIEQRPGNWRDHFSHSKVIMVNLSTNTP